MSNFITGFFTLIAAFGGIWLKDYLDQKRIAKSTQKQKAVEAYALAGRLMYAFTSRQVICANLTQDRSFNYADFYNNNPEISSNIIEQLELLVIENFYDLDSKLFAAEKCATSYGQYLYGIMTNIHNQNFKITSDEFNAKNDEFSKNLVGCCSALRNDLIDKYININSPHISIYSCIESIKTIKNFFTK